ncbi:hypothetical protein SPSIL_018350 [Sporomusa silvacetica DSM 10669]|uniref:Uncharacterized protein n=2 Tax=Sporomusa silvacetica TaxID=55504 RepID=A0ABZ3IJ19_9FIRM|nr:hypothetical protein [Sporomusa silvacetica]OZC18906.1 hypothetical protein SPSIL_25200 [Sporomusa silvacetica DSM 10669]
MLAKFQTVNKVNLAALLENLRKNGKGRGRGRRATFDTAKSMECVKNLEGYFENIEHEWLIKMVEQRVDEKAFIRLIRKWLNAGIMESGGIGNSDADGIFQEVSKTRPFYALVDGAYVFMDNNKATLYGEAYWVQNGTITKICETDKNIQLRL